MITEIMQRIVDNVGFQLTSVDIGWIESDSFFSPFDFAGIALTSNDYILLYLLIFLMILEKAVKFYLVLLPFIILGRYKVFEKANEKGYKAFIPFYSRYVLYKTAIDKGLYCILSFIPIVNIAVHIMMCIGLSRKFELKKPFTFGLIFLFPFFLIILGFNKSEYLSMATDNDN
ncbi:DUF5684 domain-containing protein [Anaerofustis stercorihominis]|uniref:DUF5684 domain-containing protein n=1 Tax=Anaerofustis stercorihominis TaxID=214853 RepID=UPI00214C64C8|nr:DUF5684 domain-containing protein [Anaerofustis stercorihominis]MCR2033547.1 DUF5684 domain-containing protein [Anaerofustis stercorihominis]